MEGSNTHIQPEEIKDLVEAKEHLEKNQSVVLRRSGSIEYSEEIVPKRSASEQVEAYAKLNKKQKQRIKQLEREILDANKETFADKEVLLDEVRTLLNDFKLNRAILEMLLSREELATLQRNAVYNDEKEFYELARFMMKEKRSTLPKLSLTKGSSNRPSINGDPQTEPIEQKTSIKCLPPNTKEPSIRDSFCLNNIIKEAK